MSQQPYNNILGERTNKYESSFFHMYLECDSPIKNGILNANVSVQDYASFVHEYIHYIQHITTPYAIKYNSYFLYELFLFRDLVDSNQKVSLPIVINEKIQGKKDLKSELLKKNGCKRFNKCNIGDIDVNQADVDSANQNKTAVNIGVYDFENNRVFHEGFEFGYQCVLESMAHLIQSLINPDLSNRDICYTSAKLVCDKLRPDLKEDTKLLISICHTSLFFDNPGHAFFMILRSADKNESGVSLFKKYMIFADITFREERMSISKMMHLILQDFQDNLNALLGNNLIFFRKVVENCKYESLKGDSVLLDWIYLMDISDIKNLEPLLDFYGYPAIDSINDDLNVPFNIETKKPYLETGALLSLELKFSRLTEENQVKQCNRYTICNRVTRENGKNLIDEHCGDKLWLKKLPCLVTGGFSYWRMSDKID